jgi:hypothetical protein
MIHSVVWVFPSQKLYNYDNKKTIAYKYAETTPCIPINRQCILICTKYMGAPESNSQQVESIMVNDMPTLYTTCSFLGSKIDVGKRLKDMCTWKLTENVEMFIKYRMYMYDNYYCKLFQSTCKNNLTICNYADITKKIYPSSNLCMIVVVLRNCNCLKKKKPIHTFHSIWAVIISRGNNMNVILVILFFLFWWFWNLLSSFLLGFFWPT